MSRSGKRLSIGKRLLLIIVLAVICTAANMAAVCIDTASMRENAGSGTRILGEQMAVPELTTGFPSTCMDNYTQVLIIKTAAYTGPEGFLQRAFGGFRSEVLGEGERDGWTAFCTYVDGSETGRGGFPYNRYWHGYMLPLRLLLCFFNLGNIQMLMFGCQLVLIVLIFIGMDRQNLRHLIIPFLLTYFLMSPDASGTCLQYVPVMMIMLLAVCLLLYGYEGILRKTGFPFLFAVSGMMTSYLDLLTAPLLTVCVPLVFLLAMQVERGERGPDLFKMCIQCSLAWGLGFAGMWALKWVINYIIFGPDSIQRTLDQILLRVSDKTTEGDTAGSISRLDALRRNFNVILAKKTYLIFLGLAAVGTLWVSGMFARDKKLQPQSLVILIPGIYPLAWLLLTGNHIYIHYYYTYRNVTALLFAVYAAAACICQSGRMQRN